MPFYTKKPVKIEAVQFTGNNYDEIKEFCPSIILMGICENGECYTRKSPIIPTLEGEHLCAPGDYVIKGVKGEFYPCKPDIFQMSYDAT